MRITAALPETNFQRASHEEMSRLRAIVLSVYPGLECDEALFARGFVGVGFQFRTAQPVKTRYFHSVVDATNDLIDALFDLPPTTGNAVLAAIVGHGDIPWQKQDGSKGALLEVGLCPTHGLKLPTPNAWRGLLDGTRNLLAPTPPRLGHVIEPSPVRIWRQG